MGKSCWLPSLTNQQLFPIQIFLSFPILNCCKILYSNATDLKLGSSTYFFPVLFSFLVFTKCQVLNVTVGRSRDQVLQRAYYQNALRCNLCNADLCHARAILHKRKNTEYNSLPQSILVALVK